MALNAKIRFAVSVLILVCMAACLSGDEKKATVSAEKKLADAGANTWVLLSQSKSGGRSWPMFVYHPGLKRYLLSAGSGFRSGYDQVVFDPANCAWSNFYPKGKGRLPSQAKMGQDGPGVHKNGVFRIRRRDNAFKPTDPHTYYQWALSGEDGCLYAYFQNTTLRFDAQTGLWKRLKVSRFSRAFKGYNSNLTMGSLAWDPINNEVVSCGGNSDNNGGSPGTWTFKPGAKKWERVQAGSEKLRSLREKAQKLELEMHALVNAWRNRFYVTETEEEAKADIDQRAAALTKDLEALIESVRASGLSGLEKNIPEHAVRFLTKVLETLKTAAGQDDARKRLLTAQKTYDRLKIAARALDAEPCGRGLSQMAVDPKRGKIVLFGGSRLDSYLADTWVYHCKERKWEQRWPEVSPAPRSGHLLGWLPKSGRIVLFGSTTYDTHYAPPRQNKNTPQDLWVYDIEANRWKRLPQSGKPPRNGTGAVGPNDELVFVPRLSGRGGGARQTWGLRVNAEAPDAKSAKAGVAPGTVKYIFRGPDAFDRKARIEPKKIDAFLKNLPPNQWTSMPRQGPNANGHEWCASAYDAKRHQILFYGGGHSRWHFIDVSHYSLRTATWSTGYRDEFPFGPSAFKSPINQSFNNRPFFGSHIWNAVAYDAPANRMVICTRGGLRWAYDPTVREWDYPPLPTKGNAMRVSMCESPHGAVQWGSGKLFLYDKKTGTWRRLPVKGKLGGAYCDSTGICYDSKRDCLWLSGRGSPMFRYDFKGGKLTRLSCPRPAKAFVRETVYVPELDMVLCVSRNRGDGGAGNLAYDISAGKWVLIGTGPANAKLNVSKSWQSHVSDGLHYDPAYKVVIHHRNTHSVLVMRPEKKSLKIFEAPRYKPKKK